MHVDVIPIGELTAAQRHRWLQVQHADPALHSPFFSPAFAQAAGHVLPGVCVGMIRAGDASRGDGRIVGFFPFQREPFGAARPVGFPIADQHGLIAERGLVIGALQLLRACGIGLWEFEYVPAAQSAFVAHMSQRYSSPIVELRSYVPPKGELRKIRKLEKEAGPLRFEIHSADPKVLATLIDWKREQYARTGFPDVFAQPWARPLIDRLHAAQEPEFAGVLSALYAGDALVAAHFGLRSRTVWHWWFPAYDPQCAAGSPGMVLLLKMLEHAPTIGIDLLDFGPGDELFKQRFATGSIELASGVVRASTLAAMATFLRRRTTRVLAQSPLHRPARALYHAFRGA